jgi:hypothetical protein
MSLDTTKVFWNRCEIIQRETVAELPVLNGSGSPTLGTYCWVTQDGGQLWLVVADPTAPPNSLVWVHVATPSAPQSWAQTQTFFTTVFKRAAIPESVNGGALYPLVVNSPPLIRMNTAGAAKSVTLFAPGAANVGKQWVIFDAARDASGAGPITISLSNPANSLNGVVNGTATITTDGGALVVRVSAAGSWETIGY